MKENMQRFADLGLKIMVTEFEAKCSDFHGGVPCFWTKGAREEQAHLYRDAVDACWNQPACISFASWGVTDADSWCDNEDGERHPFLFDKCLQPKDAYWSVREVMER